jgi:hypothetical protein
MGLKVLEKASSVCERPIRRDIDNSLHCSAYGDRLCYRSKGPGFDPRTYKIFWEVAGLERGPLSLVRTTEERLRSRKPRLTAVGIRYADTRTRKSWH